MSQTTPHPIDLLIEALLGGFEVGLGFRVVRLHPRHCPRRILLLEPGVGVVAHRLRPCGSREDDRKRRETLEQTHGQETFDIPDVTFLPIARGRAIYLKRLQTNLLDSA